MAHLGRKATSFVSHASLRDMLAASIFFFGTVL